MSYRGMLALFICCHLYLLGGAGALIWVAIKHWIPFASPIMISILLYPSYLCIKHIFELIQMWRDK